MNPREMERYNPFAADNQTAPTGFADLKQSHSSQHQLPFGQQQAMRADVSAGAGVEATKEHMNHTQMSSRYSTSFPDPFGLDDHHASSSRFAAVASSQAPPPPPQQPPSNRSNSVTFLNRIGDRDDDQPAGRAGGQQRAGGRQPGGGFTSFLSRATSVTSSSVTDRVSGAVGSVRSAVDSLSSQIQQAVPSSSAAASSPNVDARQQQQQQQQQATTSLLDNNKQQQSAASYFASRLSSATNQFVGAASASSSGASSQQDGQTATICRQRVVLILENVGAADWNQQFNQYRRLISGLAPQSSSASLAFTSFLAAQFSSSSSSSGGQSDGAGGTGSDLIEQVNFKDVSVLANQSSATAAVYVSGASAALGSSTGSSSSSLPINRLALNIVGGGSSSASQQQQQASSAKIIRPEYVVVRQRGREHSSHLKSIVKALDYCCVPMFEPYEVWSVFQDRQLIFAKLLRVQRQLGKENFPLIPQIFCQTHQDLLNYINNSFVTLPCLVRTGPLGKGKIRIDNLQMLKDFATIMATSEQSCTIEQHLDVKCDLIVQKLGTSLKLFKGKFSHKESLSAPNSGGASSPWASDGADHHHYQQQTGESDLFGQQQQYSRGSITGQDSFGRQSASRQTSLSGGGVLSSLISAGGSGSGGGASGSQLFRNNSNPTSSSNLANFEKLSEVNARYRRWVEAISKEFDNKIDVFCIKIVVANNDREYIVGMRNCSMNFLGSQENQEEDKRSFVELVISKMNTILPKHQPVSREPSAAANCTEQAFGRKQSGENEGDGTSTNSASTMGSKTLPGRFGSDKRATFMSQMNVAGGQSGLRFGQSQEAPSQNSSAAAATHTILNNRNRSVSMNQGEPMRPLSQAEWNQSTIKQPLGGGGSASSQSYLPRRASDRSDSMLTNNDDYSLGQVDSPSAASSSNARQQSLGQSFFDQTSTALSSFQRQSLSFLRRLDTRAGAEYASGSAATPPLSAKSDTVFDRAYGGQPSNGDSLDGSAATYGSAPSRATSSTKSQSMDVNTELAHKPPAGSHPPPKPPPPASIVNRQSSLANYSSSPAGQQQQHRASLTSQQRVRSESSSTNPMTPQNSLSQGSFSLSDDRQRTSANGGAGGGGQRQPRVVRQNSALSAFEPFDASLRSENYQEEQQSPGAKRDLGGSSSQSNANSGAAFGGARQQPPGGGGAAGVKYDTASVKSGNSNTSDETTTAEDTMNNLKKTFASIFGDKCE